MKSLETYTGSKADIDYYTDFPAQIFPQNSLRGLLGNEVMISPFATRRQASIQGSRRDWLSSRTSLRTSIFENSQGVMEILQTLDPSCIGADPYLEIANQFGFPITAKLNDQPEPSREKTFKPFDPHCGSTTKTAFDEFLQPVLQLEKGGHIDAALDVLYDRMDDLLKVKQFAIMDALLRQADVDSLSVDVLLGLLTSSLPARSKLPARSWLFTEAQSSIERRGEWEDGLLAGLESRPEIPPNAPLLS